MTKLFLFPDFGTAADPGDGGIRRVVEAQRLHLPHHGIELVNMPSEADVLACHMAATPEIMRAAAGKPLVAHNHGIYWAEYEWGVWEHRATLECLRLVRAADITTAPTEWVANSLRRHTSRPVLVVPHGVSQLDWIFGDVAETTHDGYVLWNKTRIDPVCDPSPAIAAAVRLPGIPFVITPELEHLPPNVTSLGRQPWEEAKATVQRAGVYLATVRETFGIGTLEALAAGVPVVGYRWGGQEDIVTHLQDGYLAAPGDVADLAVGIRWALANRDAISPWARAKAEAFSWDAAMDMYADIYHTLAQPKDDGPDVSVVVTAYNLAAYLPRALASVQTQQGVTWECIVVDDASPDDCGDIADDMVRADSRFRAIHNIKNQYLAESRNVGIRAARGRYILPLDADDQLGDPHALAVLAGALDADRELQVAYGGVAFVNPAGALVDFGRGREAGQSGWPVDFSLERLLPGPGQPLPYASMFRREAWRLTGGYRRRTRSSEDSDFFIRLASYGFPAKKVTNVTTLLYTDRPDGMSHQPPHDGQAMANRQWFPWIRHPELLPAGAQTATPILAPSFDPPLIAVIIPVGPGHEALVKDAIDSVDAQTFRSWECIVVNDSGRQLPELPAWVHQVDARDGVWFTATADLDPTSAAATDEGGHASHWPQMGVAAARNRGIAASKAPYFLPLDADDFLQPDALAVLAVALQGLEAPTVLYPDMWEDPEEPGRYRRYEFADYDPDLLTSAKGALHSVTALTPRVAWEAVGGYDGTAPWEDWDFQLKVADAGYCSRRVARPLFTYRKHTGTRRADRYARRQDAEAAMMARWGDVIEGRRTLMCSSCSRGRTINPGGTISRREATPTGLVRLRYLGDKAGSLAIRGPVTGVLYSFSASQPEAYVREADAPGLVAQGRFAGAAVEAELEPTIDAPGPPPQTGGATATMAPPAPAPTTMMPGQGGTPKTIQDLPPPDQGDDVDDDDDAPEEPDAQLPPPPPSFPLPAGARPAPDPDTKERRERPGDRPA